MSEETLKICDDRASVFSAHTATMTCVRILHQVLLNYVQSFENMTFLRSQSDGLEQVPMISTHTAGEENFLSDAKLLLRWS